MKKKLASLFLSVLILTGAISLGVMSLTSDEPPRLSFINIL